MNRLLDEIGQERVEVLRPVKNQSRKVVGVIFLVALHDFKRSFEMRAHFDDRSVRATHSVKGKILGEVVEFADRPEFEPEISITRVPNGGVVPLNRFAGGAPKDSSRIGHRITKKNFATNLLVSLGFEVAIEFLVV